MSHFTQFSFRGLNADIWNLRILDLRLTCTTCKISENTSYTREKKLIDQAVISI